MAGDKAKHETAGERGKQTPAQKGKDGKKKRKGEEDKDADLSEEDLELKQNLEMLVERIRDSDPGVQSSALQVSALAF